MSNMLPWRRRKREDDFGLSGVREDLSRLYDMVASGDFGMETFRDWGKFTPAIDIVENDDAVVIKADVPGLDPKDIDVSISGQTLTIKGEKCEESEDKEKGYYRSERRYGAFTRTVALPSNVDADKIKADCKKGVLTITLPKVESEKPKRISIKSEE